MRGSAGEVVMVVVPDLCSRGRQSESHCSHHSLTMAFREAANCALLRLSQQGVQYIIGYLP